MNAPKRKQGVVPAPQRAAFPIVGVGASTGGLEAFRQMLGALPIDTGMGFVLVQHLSPTHPSLLAEILARTTALPVTEVRDEPQVEPNHIYVIPPDRRMCILDGGLRLVPREERGEPRSIDYFLHSLAADQGAQAIGIILSGTATDGTRGLLEIKAAGGVTFAQDDTAQESSMPRSAVDSGCVDFVLSPEEIAAELGRIALHPRLAWTEAPQPSQPSQREVPSAATAEPEIGEVLELLHEVTGVDFTPYKPNTFYRRISRRMILRQTRTFKEYVRLLASDPAEVQALYQDVLINVTSFFRNPEVFEMVKSKVLPELFRDRSPQQSLRVWVPGCAKGEEAYSLAIAIAEFAESQASHLPVQIFATDLNESVIEKARKGVYPESITRDLSPERLRRFFVEDGGQYRVAKSIREQCVFARHNVLTDPPFSQLDLIGCRNFLIYLEPSTQKRVMLLLHYALKPKGFLVLGSSETAATYRDLFQVVDARSKIFRSKVGVRRLALGSAGEIRKARGRTARPGETLTVEREAERILLAKYAPPSVVVDDDLEICQFRGDTGPYLAPAPGKASLNLLKMAREGLAVALRIATSRARKEAVSIRRAGLRVQWNRETREVAVEVIPLHGSPAEGAFLILFEATLPLPPVAAFRGEKNLGEGPSEEGVDLPSARLAEELLATRESLQAVIEQQEEANNDLQAASEELQSANEELQSLNEELETSKEEIQSTNEELSTVNEELQNRNQELHQSTSDMVNLLGSVDTAILMLGPDLHIRRFTPAAEPILNLIPTDLGRPIGHVRLKIDVPELETWLAEVLETASVFEREIQDRKGHWYLLRIRPYRTLDDRIDGAVVMLVDIDRLKSAHQFAQSIVATVREALLVLDATLRVQMASPSFYRTFKMMPEETEGRSLYALGDLRDAGNASDAGDRHRPWNQPALRRRLSEVLSEDVSFEGFEVEQDFGPIGNRILLLNARRLAHQNGDSPLILLAIEDITERKMLERALGRQVEELAAADRSKNEFLALLAHELRNPLAPLRNSLNLLETPGADGAVTGRALQVMHRQIRNMARLIDDLLDVSRITRGKVLLQKEPVELIHLLRRSAEVVQHEIVSRGQQLTLTLGSRPIYLDADATRIEQIFGNLLHNASKFTPPGGHIEVTTGVSTEASGVGEILVRVADDGIGIAPEMLSRVFDLFVQAQRSLDRSQGGLGIGLTLVRSLVELHGGTIEARSAGLGQGSELLVHLPLFPHAVAAAERENAPGELPADVPADVPVLASGRGARRALVVDDNVDAAESLVLLLRLRGHEVAIAFSGPMALEAVAAFHPDIVLLDIGLPGLDGYQVARAIRRQEGGAKVILVALTGYGQEEDRRLALEAGFDHHLTKPVDPTVIYALVAAGRE